MKRCNMKFLNHKINFHKSTKKMFHKLEKLKKMMKLQLNYNFRYKQ